MMGCCFRVRALDRNWLFLVLLSRMLLLLLLIWGVTKVTSVGPLHGCGMYCASIVEKEKNTLIIHPSIHPSICQIKFVQKLTVAVVRASPAVRVAPAEVAPDDP